MIIYQLNFNLDWSVVEAWLLDHGINIGIILLVSLMVIWVVRLSSRGLQTYIENKARNRDSSQELIKRATTLSRLIRRLTRIFVGFVAIILIMLEFGVDIGPILAGAGIAGIAVGFAAQKMIQDYFSGFFILLENQYRVGDVITVAGVSGAVEEVNMRTTVIRDWEGRVHTIPNGEIAVVTNFTKTFSYNVVDVSVAYKEDVDHVMAVLRHIGDEMMNDEHCSPCLLAPLEVQGVHDFGDSAIIIRTRLTTLPDMRWEMARNYRRRIKIEFDKEGIEIPFPHRTLYYGDADKNKTLS